MVEAAVQLDQLPAAKLLVKLLLVPALDVEQVPEGVVTLCELLNELPSPELLHWLAFAICVGV